MLKKVLAIFYYGVFENQEINAEDIDKFYIHLKKNYLTKLEENGIRLEVFTPSSAKILNENLSNLKKSYNELYLHFNGHGEQNGIPYDNWLLSKIDFANILDDSKVKFCFFSSCNSKALSEELKDKKIPIVIGIDGEIGNNHAIDIQKKFYGYLVDKMPFVKAFNLAVSKSNLDKSNFEVNDSTRGIGRKKAFEKAKDCELNMLIDEGEEGRYLIYENIIEQIEYTDDRKEIVLVYATRQDVLKEFKKEFIEDGLDDLDHEIFLLNKEDVSDIENGFKDIIYKNLKIILIISGKPEDFFRTLNVEIFDNDQALNAENIKFGILIKEGLDKTLFFNQTEYFLEINFQNHARHRLFFYSSIGEQKFGNLFTEGPFNEFFTDIIVKPEERKKIIRKFPCKQIKKDSEVSKINRWTQNLFRVFFASEENTRLVHYIINLIKYYRTIPNQVLIVNSEFSNKSQSVYEWLNNSINANKTYKSKYGSHTKPYINVKGDLIIVFRTNFRNDKLLKEKITTFLQEMEAHKEDKQLTEDLRLIFFINESSNFSYDETISYNVAKTKSFSKPPVISFEIFEEWKDQLFEDKTQGEIELIQSLFINLTKSELAKFEKDCPSNLIGKICDEFKISSNKFLNI